MRELRTTTKRHTLNPAEMAPVLAELSPAGDGAVPESVTGWTKKSKWTRMQAVYPNGWQIDVYFSRDGRVSSVTSKFKTVARVKAAG